MQFLRTTSEGAQPHTTRYYLNGIYKIAALVESLMVSMYCFGGANSKQERWQSNIMVNYFLFPLSKRAYLTERLPNL